MFRDREDGGRQLAERLKGFELRDPLVLGIPRDGVVTGAMDAARGQPSAHELLKDSKNDAERGTIGWTVTD
jgi:hypothetical protein